MSKIQDAIRKIQSRNAEHDAGARKDAWQRTRALASVSDRIVEDGETLPVNRSRKVVNVNRDRLREAGFLAPEDQQRLIADQYRNIKRPLLDNAMGDSASLQADSNLIMIASALPGDGKTFNCINLALSMSVEKDSSVLLVDADVAKPHISRLFALEDEPGLIDVLKDPKVSISDVIVDTDVPGLYLVPAGTYSDQSTELLASRRMEATLRELSQANPNRIVMFDSPPLLAASEARVLASNMGQIALVVCANRTPQQAVTEAIASLDESKPVNIILNQVSSRSRFSSYGEYGYDEVVKDTA